MLAGAEVAMASALGTTSGSRGERCTVHARVPGSPPGVELAGVCLPRGPIGLGRRASLAPGPAIGCRIAAGATAASGTAAGPLLAVGGVSPLKARRAPAASLLGPAQAALDARRRRRPRFVAALAPGPRSASEALGVRAVEAALGFRLGITGAVGNAVVLQAPLTLRAVRCGRGGAALGAHPGGDPLFRAALVPASLACALAVSTVSIPVGHGDLHGEGEVEGERPAGATKGSVPAGVVAQRHRPRRAMPVDDGLNPRLFAFLGARDFGGGVVDGFMSPMN